MAKLYVGLTPWSHWNCSTEADEELVMKNLEIRVNLRVKMQPRPAESIMPPLLIVNVAGENPPPILFWPSESWPIVPDSPPDAVSSKEQEDLGTATADAPKIKERATNVFMVANV
jgi:hypothetical protein